MSLEDMTVTPRPYYFRSRNVESVTPELGRILEKHPPPGDNCSVIVHHAHGAALKANPDASFAVRSPHLVLGFGAALAPSDLPTDPELQAVSKRADALAEAISEAGLSIERGYMSFTPPNECDTLQFFGQETTSELRPVKEKYDGGNLFRWGYPKLV